MKIVLILIITIFSYSFELKYKSFVSDFNQSVISENKKINYEGKIYLKDNLIYYHYTKPIEKKIWINKKIYVYEPDLEQVTIYKKSDNLFNLIKSAKKIAKNLYLKEYDNKKIYFKVENNLIKGIYYKDKVDNLVTIKFFNIEKKELNKTLFIPSYPDYVDIIYAN